MQLPWTVGDTVNMSIGQGFASYTTPIAIMFAVPANGGYSSASLIKDNEAAKTLAEVLKSNLRQFECCAKDCGRW